MKKLFIIFLSMIFILSVATVCYAESLQCSIGLTCSSTKINKDIKKVEIQLNLNTYQGDGTLGYEGKIEYDKNVFENITIKQADNWESVSYESQTGKFVSTTTNAKAGNVAIITLSVKEGITAKTSDVAITGLTFSDGDSTVVLEKTITFTIEQNAENNDSNNIGNNDTNKDDTNKDDKNNSKDDDNKNDGQDNNKNNNQDGGSNSSNSDDKNNDDNKKEENTIIVTPVDKDKADGSTAINKIPQTGESNILIAIFVVSIIGAICYIRYRSIQIK